MRAVTLREDPSASADRLVQAHALARLGGNVWFKWSAILVAPGVAILCWFGGRDVINRVLGFIAVLVLIGVFLRLSWRIHRLPGFSRGLLSSWTLRETAVHVRGMTDERLRWEDVAAFSIDGRGPMPRATLQTRRGIEHRLQLGSAEESDLLVATVRELAPRLVRDSASV